MSKIKIKNFGPIKEGYLEDGGFMDIKKVTVFIGNQGSGKSTVAKVISTMLWLEKSINRGDLNDGIYKNTAMLSRAAFWKFFEFQRIHNYFKNDTEIEFVGEKIKILYSGSGSWPTIEINDTANFNVPKVMYVPAERNFLSVVKNAFGIKNLPDTLYTFAEELRKGQLELNDKLLELPIGDLQFKYSKHNETSYLVGEDYELDLLESSSGYQSLVPLYLVTKFLSDELEKGEQVLREQLSVEQSVRRNKEIADVMFNNKLSENEKSIKVKEIDSKYLNTCFINIVEEPEQNLFPSSQQKILSSLLEFNNKNVANKLIMTVHSPYIINYLSIAIQGAYLLGKIKDSDNLKDLIERFNLIVSEKAVVSASDFVVYQMDENTGTISKLGNPEGIPSDKNYLNQFIAHGNQMFDSLLELEEEL